MDYDSTEAELVQINCKSDLINESVSQIIMEFERSLIENKINLEEELLVNLCPVESMEDFWKLRNQPAEKRLMANVIISFYSLLLELTLRNK